jgi:predicted dienelactone hydrolase
VVTVLRDTSLGHAPILVLSHGRGPDRLTMGRARFPLAARFFVEHGYLVVMPTRIGYGETGGPDVETRGRDCEHAEFEHGFATAADESLFKTTK